MEGTTKDEYIPVANGSRLQGANVPRGTKMCIGLVGVLLVLLLVLVIGFAVLAIGNARHDKFEAMMPDWLAQRVAEWNQGTLRYQFRQVVDAVTLAPIANSLALLYGAPQSVGVNAIAIAKGWVELVLPLARADGRVAYNVSVVTPSGNRITALEVAVTTFAAPNGDPRLVPKSSLVLCGGPDNPSCLPLATDARDTYSSAVVVPAAVIARQSLAVDDLHVAYFLVVYMADKAGLPLAKQDIRFVIELTR
jgi:hypothetical protein